MHKNAQEFLWKMRSKIACDYTWLLVVKFACLEVDYE